MLADEVRGGGGGQTTELQASAGARRTRAHCDCAHNVEGADRYVHPACGRREREAKACNVNDHRDGSGRVCVATPVKFTLPSDFDPPKLR